MNINVRSKLREHPIKVIIKAAAAAATAMLLFNTRQCAFGPGGPATITTAVSPLSCAHTRPETHRYIIPY